MISACNAATERGKGSVRGADDSANQLTTVSGNGHTASFTYDGLGRCVRRIVTGTTLLFTYDDWNPILEWDGLGNWKAWTIYGAKADEVLARYDATYGPLIYKEDNQGDVTFLLDGGNRVIEKYSYDVFGRPTVTSWNYASGSWKVPSDRSSFGNRFMFTGREWIPELNIYDYRHRFYNPDNGRFLQTDPTGFDAGDMNLFRYCGDDPVDRSDPTGLIWESEGFELVHDYSQIPNVYITRAFNPRATGVTLQRFWIDAHINQRNGKYVLEFDDIQIRSHSYIRTYQPAIIGGTPGYYFPMTRIWGTGRHEARQQGIDRGLYKPLKEDVKRAMSTVEVIIQGRMLRLHGMRRTNTGEIS
jgi:RHS repeat-associated protein